jgi:phosphate transport system substrate-binding protein
MALAVSVQYTGVTVPEVPRKCARLPAIRAFVAEFTKESAIGPKGYLVQHGLIASPGNVRARSQLAARNLVPLNLASVK